MSTGAAKLTMARADVVIDGHREAKGATVTVIGTTALATDRLGHELLRMEATEVIRHSRKSVTVVGADGTTWVLTAAGCGCAGR